MNMIGLEGEAKIRCEVCREPFYVSGVDVEVDITGSEERGMGEEVFYFGLGEFNCPNCENKISIEYDASEYPVGALNYNEINVYGGEILEGFGDIEISFGTEIYSLDKELQLYLPEKKKIITNLCDSTSDLIYAVSKNPRSMYEMTSREFEELIALIFSKHGFHVELTKKTRDGGKDIVAIRSDLGIRAKYIVECKRYSENRPIRVGLVRELYGVQMREGANKSVLVTTSYFTQSARSFAEDMTTLQWSMDLKGFDDIVKWVNDTKYNG